MLDLAAGGRRRPGRLLLGEHGQDLVGDEVGRPASDGQDEVDRGPAFEPGRPVPDAGVVRAFVMMARQSEPAAPPVLADHILLGEDLGLAVDPVLFPVADQPAAEGAGQLASIGWE